MTAINRADADDISHTPSVDYATTLRPRPLPAYVILLLHADGYVAGDARVGGAKALLAR